MLELLFQNGIKAVTQGTMMPVLPSISSTRTYDLATFQDNIYQYHCCTDWPSKIAVVHPCWFAMQALQQQTQLFTDKAQPFKVVGLVHVANNMQVNQWVNANATVTISCRFGRVWSHPRGYMFNVLTTVTQHCATKQETSDDAEADAQVIMTIDSHYLARQAQVLTTGLPTYPTPVIQAYDESQIVTSQLPLPSDLGKVYAKISGDYNPIHLHPLSAKLFGLKRHIAHGMWTKAKTFSTFTKQLWADAIKQNVSPPFPQPLTIDVQFLQMLYLPGQVDIRMQDNGTEVLGWVVSADRPKPYLQMRIGKP
jgi:acyl dehydratase